MVKTFDQACVCHKHQCLDAHEGQAYGVTDVWSLSLSYDNNELEALSEKGSVFLPAAVKKITKDGSYRDCHTTTVGSGQHCILHCLVKAYPVGIFSARKRISSRAFGVLWIRGIAGHCPALICRTKGG